MAADTAYRRRTSGLARTASLKDVFAFNIYFTSFTLAVVFVYVVGLVVAPNGNMILGLLIATGIILFQVLMYAFMAAAMPRSGGDYIYLSRILHPAAASIVAWAWIIWLGFWVGFGGFTLVSIGLGGLFTTLGLATGSANLVGLGTAITAPMTSFAIGTIVIILFALLAVAGLRWYFRAQTLTFAIGVLSLIISFAVLLATPVADYIARFNTLMAPYSGVQDTYHAVIDAAKAGGWSVGTGSDWNQTLLWIPAAYIAIPWTMGTIFIGAEVKDVQRNQIVGLVLAYLFVAFVTVATAGLLANSAGYDFFSAFSYLVFNPSSSVSVPIAPYYNYLIFFLIQNPIVSVIASLGFIFLGWMYMVQNMINTSRILMAMSFDRMMPGWFSKVNERFRTPVNATIFMFVVSMIWLALITFTPYFYVASSMFALNLAVSLVALAALLFPFLKKDLFEASPIRWRVAGVPVISIVGLITIVLDTFTAYNYATNAGFGTNADVSLYLVFGSWVVGLLAYFVAWGYQKSKGTDLSLMFKEIPEV